MGRKVFPAWFRCLSKSAEPSEFARAVVTPVTRRERRQTIVSPERPEGRSFSFVSRRPCPP